MDMVCHMIASQEQTSNWFAWVKTPANQAKNKGSFYFKCDPDSYCGKTMVAFSFYTMFILNGSWINFK